MLVLVLLVVVVVLDQATKWWAWRHFSWTRINSGGDILVGRRLGSWYADPVTGALLDLLDCGLLSVAVSVLARSRAPAAVSVPGALMTGGWTSNLLDRLGTHYWTAPGSVRGVVDFIHLGGHYYNIADFFIIGCTSLFLLAAGHQAVRARRPTPAGSAPPPAPSRARERARIPALVGASLVLVVALGAANYGGVSAAPRTPAPAAHPLLLFSGSCADRTSGRSFQDGTPQDGAPQDRSAQDGVPQDGVPQDGAAQDRSVRYCLHHGSSAILSGPIGP